MTHDTTIDYDQHWTESAETYRNHPTSRHRRRFVIRSLRRLGVAPGDFVFDYGCGAGMLLQEIQAAFKLNSAQLGGCDLSAEAVRIARETMPSPCFFHQAYPDLDRPIDIGITTEVIEHTSEYEAILTWLRDHIRPGGILIVTTPGGNMDPPDEYYGHIQHFTVPQLRRILESLGFEILVARYWGFPLFSLQKWVTRRNFDRVKAGFMEGGLNAKKRLVFTLAYYAYLIHDFIPKGPQIFIAARKGQGSAP